MTQITDYYALIKEGELLGMNLDGTPKEFKAGDVAYIETKLDGLIIAKWLSGDNTPMMIDELEFSRLFKKM